MYLASQNLGSSDKKQRHGDNEGIQREEGSGPVGDMECGKRLNGEVVSPGWAYRVLCSVKLIRHRKRNAMRFHLYVESKIKQTSRPETGSQI